MKKFPENFMLGASTAAHQVEGNNIHSDYWAQEQMEHSSFVEPSLDAVDHYHHYEEDIRLMAEAGLNAYRFSIEWARIEPEEGKFDIEELEHYRKVIRCCRANGIEPVVTLLHFTSPRWLIEKGGWEAESTVTYFARYCAYVVIQLGEELNYVCTINEANMGLQVAAIGRRYMQQMQKQAAEQKNGGSAEKEGTAAEKLEGSVQVGLNMESLLKRQKAVEEENIQVFGTANPQIFVSSRTPEGDLLVMRAHEAARDAMKAIRPDLKIGLTLSLHDIQAQPGGEKAAEKEWEEEFRHYLPFIRNDDFLGVQNYTRTLMGADGSLPAPEGAELTQMNYEFYPEALEHVIRKVAEEFQGELLVTENGIATADDTRRVEFIRRALQGVQACIQDGIPVKGYMHWSLLDNFEWQKGFSMMFGLIAVDRKTRTRYPKPSLAYLGSWRQA
ncbi:glycoside hydrolase family 1 protein [Marvinbryantia formatexigens]|nr:family 1 glycosylhydrolase [Marvinbryantia formatexigens]UWO23656.1 family 1 glycosylhydrolase [Marvinbryantia formatexigens DSM 14469]SDF64782.1 aryl-beta-glucosidase [Marvinbryantia formatexigens]